MQSGARRAMPEARRATRDARRAERRMVRRVPCDLLQWDVHAFPPKKGMQVMMVLGYS